MDSNTTDESKTSNARAAGITPLEVLSLIGQSRRTRQVWYVAAPLWPTENQIARLLPCSGGAARLDAIAAGTLANVHNAKRWLSWLIRRYPTIAFIAPWIATFEADYVAAAEDGDDDDVPRMVDVEAAIARCDGMVLCGGRISGGMARGRDVAARFVDLTSLGELPPATAEREASAVAPRDRAAGQEVPLQTDTAGRLAATPGYELLAAVLDEALQQAQDGKGKERHGFTGATFEQQSIIALNELIGSIDGQAYQVAKKLIESTRLSPDRARRDLLGAINYAAAAVIQLDRQDARRAGR